MNEKILTTSQVNKIYNSGQENEVRAISDIDLDITKGEMLAIMGPSGSGKTTLLNCISGIDAATSGEIILDGQDLQKMKDKPKTKYRAEKMGFIFQTFNLIPVLTAIENVEMPLLVNGTSQTKASKKAAEMLGLVGLGDRLKHKPNELSGGQQQRVTVARALVHKPVIVWADEPTGNLDSKTANEIMNLICDLNKETGVTFVLVTHDAEVAGRAGRILRMKNGEIIDNG